MISYKCRDKSEKAWFQQFCRDLQERGVDAVPDEYGAEKGQSFSDYIIKCLREADHLLLVVFPETVTSIEKGGNGDTFEKQLHELRQRVEGYGFSITPVLRYGEATPAYLWDNRCLDFRDDGHYQQNINDLADWFLGKTKIPALGGYLDLDGYYARQDDRDALEAFFKG
ncbi:TIR domain-containing protein [Fibrobacterota bacterium]